MSLIGLGQGIATAFAAVTGIKQAFSPDALPVSVNTFPCVIIMPTSIVYHGTFASEPDFIFRVIIITDVRDQATALTELIPFMDPTGTQSFHLASETDKTFGGTCADSHLDNNKGIGSIQWGGSVPYICTEFNLQVWG